MYYDFRQSIEAQYNFSFILFWFGLVWFYEWDGKNLWNGQTKQLNKNLIINLIFMFI